MPSIVGGDKVVRFDYFGVSTDWISSKSEECDSFFHGYTTNPMLCKACQRPVTEHKTYMARLEEKKQAKAKVKAELEKPLSDLRRKELIDVCGNEIDKADPEVDLGGGIKLRRSFLDLMAEIYEKDEQIRRDKLMRDQEDYHWADQ